MPADVLVALVALYFRFLLSVVRRNELELVEGKRLDYKPSIERQFRQFHALISFPLDRRKIRNRFRLALN